MVCVRAMNIKIVTLAVLGLALTALPASAVELVVNGGFETGDTSGWSDTSDSGNVLVGNSAHGGAFGYLNGSVEPPGVLSQLIATIAGESYAYSFWLENDGAPNSFTASLGGIPLVVLVDADSFLYQQFSGSVIAPADNTSLSFAFSNAAAFWGLDDVSVDAPPVSDVPEPMTWALLLTGFAVAGTVLRRRHSTLAAA